MIEDNEDNLERRREAIRIQKRIEDQWRDDMTAMAYMNSTKFGSGVPVVNVSQTGVFSEEREKSDRAPLADIPEVAFQIDTQSVDPPPRESPLVQELQIPEYSIGGMDAEAGIGEPEIPMSAPPVFVPPVMPMQVAQVEPIAEPEFKIQTPVFSATEYIPPPPIAEPPPEEQKREEPKPKMPSIFEAMGVPELRNVDKAFELQPHHRHAEETGAEAEGMFAVDAYANSHNLFAEHVVETLLYMADKLHELSSRMREMETVVDRRYWRQYR